MPLIGYPEPALTSDWLQEIFGSKAWVGHDECWDRNTAGNWLGNCNYVVMGENTVNGKTTETIDYKQCKEK